MPARSHAAVDRTDTEPRKLPSLQLLTLHEAAARLSLSYWGVRDLIVRGHLAAVRLPGKTNGKDLRRVLIAIDDLQKFVSEHRVQRPVAGAAVRPIKRRAAI